MRLLKLSIFVIFAIFWAVILAGCAAEQPPGNQVAVEPSEPPFSNSEPERYQAVVVQSSPTGSVRFLIARDGEQWRIDAEYGSQNQTGSLHVDKKDYVLDFAKKAYSEYTAGHGFDERPGMVEDISHGLLNSLEMAHYQLVGTEGELTRYKMTNSKGKEAIITIDTVKGLPVKKEIYNLSDGGRQLEMTITLEDLRLEPDAANFELPKDFKKVPISEMKKILSGGN